MESTIATAAALLAAARQTPMRRGNVPVERHELKEAIAAAIADQGVVGALANRMATQIVFKCDASTLDDRAIWTALGEIIRCEVHELSVQVGLSERQIVTVLPKLSAAQVKEFLDELSASDRKIARTILNAALEAAEPLSAGRRYLAEYCQVAAQLHAIDPTISRTLANATFTAGAPRNKAMELLQRFTDVMKQFGGTPEASRMLARATFRAPDPIRAAEEFISDYNAVVQQLVAAGVDLPGARTIAGLRQLRRTRERDQRRPELDTP